MRLFKYLKIFSSIAILSFSAIIFFKIYQLHDFTYLDFLIFLFGYFCADIFSGIVHWVGDTFGDENTPFWGKHFIEPFRVHHTDPKYMTRIPLWENLGTSCIASLSLQSGLIYLLTATNPTSQTLHIYLFLNTLFLMTAISNFFHRYAHIASNDVPTLIKWLQNKHLILNPKSHRIHHKSPYDTHFCVTNGWANTVLEKVNFWTTVKKIFFKG